MAALISLQVVVVVPYLLISLIMNQVHSQDGTSFSFVGFPPTTSDLTFQGDARILQSGAVQLTRTDALPEFASVGRVLYSPPVQLWDDAGRQSSFRTEITFEIALDQELRPADGIAFFIVPVGSTIPLLSSGGRFGLTGPLLDSNFVAVEFDVHQDGDVGDPELPHFGIDVNNVISTRVVTYGGLTGRTVRAFISYDVSATSRGIIVDVSGSTEQLRYELDLKTVLPQQVQVGISASTGLTAAALHRINSWTFDSIMIADSIMVADNN